MCQLNKNQYSVIQNIITDAGINKKKLKELVIEFVNLIRELYGIQYTENNIQDSNSQEVLEFLLKWGIINDHLSVDGLKDIIGKDYKKLIDVIKQYIKLDVPVPQEVQKYMDYYRRNKVEEYLNDMESLTLVDFFCGAGGMSLGFAQEGFRTVLANDIEQVCTDTYSFNHMEIPKNRIITGDIKELVEHIEEIVEKKVDVVIGGPPCQGFSMANRQRLIDDPRNVLYKYYVKGIEKMQPKVFVMENVKGMLSVANQVKEDFHSLHGVDYDVDYKIFNAKDFGVPQNRERLIYIGIRRDLAELKNVCATTIIDQISQYTEQCIKYTLGEAINDLPSLQALTIKNATELDTEASGKKIMSNSSKSDTDYVNLINNGEIVPVIFNHKARYNNNRDIEIFGRMWQGDKSDSERIADIMPYKSRSHIFKDKYYKLKEDDICKTITAHMKFDCNMYIHPTQARGLTPREAARVQSYPDNYYFMGPYTKTYMQIGNSVPPLMARGIAKVLKEILE